MSQIKVTYKGPLFKGIGNLFKQSMINSVDKISQLVLTTAKNTLGEKKISEPKMGGILFNSIVYDIRAPIGTKVMGKVFTDVPYAKFVENDHFLVNGRMWSDVNPKAPYEFMKEGARVGNEKAGEIINQELSKIGVI